MDEHIDISHFRKERQDKALRNSNIKPYEEIREHFILRLKERYDIVISEAEYDDILDEFKRNKFIKIYSLSYSRKVVWVEIKGKYVLCIYNKKVEFRQYVLLTCLLLDKDLRIPMPKIFGINGFTSADFESVINNTISEALAAHNDMCEMGLKDFFTNHKVDKNCKSIVHFWAKNGVIEIDKIIGYVVDKYKEDGTFKIKEIRY